MKKLIVIAVFVVSLMAAVAYASVNDYCMQDCMSQGRSYILCQRLCQN